MSDLLRALEISIIFISITALVWSLTLTLFSLCALKIGVGHSVSSFLSPTSKHIDNCIVFMIMQGSNSKSEVDPEKNRFERVCLYLEQT